MSVEALQLVRYQDMQASEDAAEDQRTARRADQAQAIEETRTARYEKIAEEAKARDERALATFIGTLICPLIGTMIGGAIGQYCGNDNREAAQAAQMEAGLSEIQRTKAKGEFEEAREDIDEVQAQNQNVEKFGRELRQAKLEEQI